jgi:hypothetical protein
MVANGKFGGVRGLFVLRLFARKINFLMVGGRDEFFGVSGFLGCLLICSWGYRLRYQVYWNQDVSGIFLAKY